MISPILKDLYYVDILTQQRIVQETGKSIEDYSRSTIVSTSAPTEMGALRKADGQEGFASKATGAAQAAVNKASQMVNGSAK